MRKNRTVNRIMGLAASTLLLAFLVLSYSTMYKQNHAIPILEYHDLTTNPADPEKPFTLPVEAFTSQMEYLSENCRVIPLKALLADMEQGRPVPANTVAITFDDGYRSNYTLGLPILEKYHLPATIFIVGKYTDEGAWYPVLTWNNLRIMTASGLIDVESHTYDLHRRISRGPNGEQAPVLPLPGGDETEAAKREREDRIQADLVKSRQLIQTNLGTTSEILSWPFSASDPGGITAAQRAGFRYLVTGTGYCYPGTSMDQIARIAVPATIDLDSFIRFAHPARLNYLQAMGAELQVIWRHISALVS